MRQFCTLIVLSCSVLFTGAVLAQEVPARVILIIIDGLHYEAPERLRMPVFSALAEEGSRIEKVTGIIPYHPAHGEYAEVHTSSYPNPMMMTGTIFLAPDQTMLQHRFEDSAFVANSRSYQSITDGYEWVIQKVGTDEFAVDQALGILRDHDVDFLRLHLQNTGNGGSLTLAADESAPYRHDIWHADSPYVAAAVEADRQVGRLVEELKRMGRWDDTLFIVTSDHGQTKTGWHPTLPEESWMFPAVFHGPGIRQGHSMEWADQTDIVPSIAHLMNVEVPNDDGGSGKVLSGVLTGGADDSQGRSHIYELNKVLARYILADARMIVGSAEHPFLNSQAMEVESDFYGLERVMEWHELGSVDALIAHNEAIVRQMEESLELVGQTPVARAAAGAAPAGFTAGKPLGAVNEAGEYVPLSSNVRVYGSLRFAESCTFDAERDRVVMMNTGLSQDVLENDGYVSLLEPDGTVHTAKWIGATREGLSLNSPLGSAIQDGLLYAADIDVVHTFDLASGRPGRTFRVPEATFLNGIAVSDDGTIYVSNSRPVERLYRITAGGEVSVFVDGKPLDRPNGVAIDAEGNIAVVNMGDNAVLSFNPQGQLVRTEHAVEAGNDGLVILPDGTKYVSSVRFGSISEIRPGREAQIIASGIPNAASMCFDPERRQLVVPMNDNNAVAFVTLDDLP